VDRGGDHQSDIRIPASASSVPHSTANRRQLPEMQFTGHRKVAKLSM
jgi:hypothetical protein